MMNISFCFQFLGALMITVQVCRGCIFGTGCLYPCNCAAGCGGGRDEECDSRCNSTIYQNIIDRQSDWFTGPSCQIGNIAFGKNATQTGAYAGLTADRAVDGRGFYNDNQLDCAHPEKIDGEPAEWVLHLGAVHRIYNVTIYNTRSAGGSWRLNNFTVGIGTTDEAANHTQCARYANDTFGHGFGTSPQQIHLECNGYGSFMSVRRHSGEEINLVTLCEVVVFGHAYSTSDTCLTNCQEPPVCNQWWALPAKCDRYIRCPQLEPESAPRQRNQTSNSITVEFMTDDAVEPGLQEFYVYYVQYKQMSSANFTQFNTSYVVHDANRQTHEIRVAGLGPNTEYNFQLVIYRSHNGIQELCASEASTNSIWTLAGPTTTTTSTTTTTHTTTTATTTTTSRSVPAGQGNSDNGGGGGGGDSDAGMIAGIVIAFVVVMAAVVFVVIFLLRRSKNQKGSREPIVAVVAPFRHENQQNGTDHTVTKHDSHQTSSPHPGAPSTSKAQAASPKPPISKNKPVVGPRLDLSNVDATYAIYENPNKRTAVSLDKLSERIGDMLLEDGFRKEYSRLPLGAKATHEHGQTMGNQDKNRFKNITAYDHSRVVLTTDGSKEQSDYINANYLTGYKDKARHYVATQGPKSHTIKDLWRMVWQMNSHRIIMITKLTESGKSKCELYWPDTVGQTVEYAGISILSVNVERFTDYTVRTFTLTKDEECRTVQQLHFTSWPDKSVPDHAFPLLSFRRKVRSLDDPTKGPMIVHCSAGVGRTGTFIAIDYLLDQAQAEKQIDVFSYVFLIRTQRMNMVQTLEQYKLIYLAIMDYINVGVTAIPSDRFPQHLSTFTKSSAKGPAPIEDEFEVLNKDTERQLPGLLFLDYDQPPYRERNRDNSILPSDKHRPYLICLTNRDDYINAVFVDNFKTMLGFIATQMPLSHTQEDLWRLLTDRNSHTLVMLNELQENSDKAYWPSEPGVTQKYGAMEVTLTKEEEESSLAGLIVREFKVSCTERPKTPAITVKQFQLQSWLEERDCPDSTDILIDLITEINKWQQESSNTSITVHCMDGCRKTGLLCSAAYMLEKLQDEHEVDVFTSVRHMRLSRPQFIVSLEQYHHLHDVAAAYLARFDIYANFQ